jgi:hypothetical protein
MRLPPDFKSHLQDLGQTGGDVFGGRHRALAAVTLQEGI